MPWNAMQRYDRVDQGPLVEFICPENNVNVGDIDPLPVAEKQDFLKSTRLSICRYAPQISP
jgi:hypothetical protein